jgi:hypothetical protein
MRWSNAYAVRGTKCVLNDLKGLKRLLLWAGPANKTKSVKRRIMALKEWIGIEDLVIEFLLGICL